jgi:hypothetical protein
MSLEQDLRESAKWLTQLANDLKSGKAKEVQCIMHVYQHMLKEETVPVMLSNIPMMSIEQCTDFLKLWGAYVYVATCPRTGVRFVEGVEK